MSTIISQASETAKRSRFSIVQDVLDLITAGELRPGSETSERILGEKLGLGGRAPVLREALALLSRDGVVEPLPQRGYLVRDFSPAEAEEIVELRAASEKIVVSRLATLGLGERLKFARMILGRVRDSAARGDCAAFAKFDSQLRCELASLGGFITAVYSIGAWSDQLRVFFTSNPLSRQAMVEVSELQNTLLEAVKGGADNAVDIVDAQSVAFKSHIEASRAGDASPDGGASAGIIARASEWVAARVTHQRSA